jgi:hypothetical protein
VDTAPIKSGDKYVSQQFCVCERRKYHRIITGRDLLPVSGFTGKERCLFTHMTGINIPDIRRIIKFGAG